MKKFLYSFLNGIGVSHLFRLINHSKILILVYHGLTSKRRRFQPWIHLPVNQFEEQIKFLKKYYHILRLSDIIDAVKSNRQLPANSAAITFDDGYHNNFSLAFPLLKKYNIPATIFLTSGYIGTKKLLPMDQIFLIIKETESNCAYYIPEIDFGPITFNSIEERQISFQKTAEILKKFEIEKQLEYISKMGQELKCEFDFMSQEVFDDFSILGWDEIEEMYKSNLIEFGAHSDTHNILTRISNTVAFKEITKSQKTIEEKLKCRVNLFAFPNGNKGDFSLDHINFLKNNGFDGAVTTIPILNKTNDSVYSLGRMSIGSDLSSDPDYLALRISGLIQLIKKMVKNV